MAQLEPSASRRHLRATSRALIVALLVVCAFSRAPLAGAANLAINNRTVDDWLVVDLKGENTYKPLFINNFSIVPHDDVSSWPVNTYYWQAPEPYYQWKIYTYGGHLQFLVKHIVTRGDTSGVYLDEPDLVLEGGSKERNLKIGYKLPKDNEIKAGYDKNQTIKMPLTEADWYHLVEQTDETTNKAQLKLSSEPVTRADFSLVLAGLNRSLIRAKYHMDQVEGDLFDVNMHLFRNRSRTIECDNDCSGALLDDLDDIGLLFDEIRRLAPMLKDGPWRRLAYLSSRADNLTQALRDYQTLIRLGEELIGDYALSFDQETRANILELRASNLDSRAPGIALEAYQTRLLAEKMLEELLKGLWDKIRHTIKLLSEFGFGPGGMSQAKIERIVQESEIILHELRNRNLKPWLDDAERELRRATALLERIKTLLIDGNKADELLKRLKQLELALVDFSRIVQADVLRPTERANELIGEGKKRYAAILALIKQAEQRAAESQANLDEAKRALEITKKCLEQESAYLDALPRQLKELNDSINEIEIKRSILTSVNPDYQRRYVDRCREHGDALQLKSQQLDGLFNATRDVANYAVRAANVYKSIAEAIDKAEKAARRALDAADKAYKEAVPEYGDSLAEQARKAKVKSLELLERASKLRDQEVQRLSLELAKRKQLVEQLTESLRQLGLDLDQINAGLRQLADKNFQEQLQELDELLRRLLERLADIHRRLQLLSDLIYNSLLPQYERLSAGSQSSLGNLSQVIELTRKDLAAALKYAANSRLSLEKLLKLEAKLDLDLDLLRRKVQLGHQQAGSVHIGLAPSQESGLCQRAYFVPAIMSARGRSALSIGGFQVRQLSLIWSLHADEHESLLLFIGSKSGDEFLVLEMYERHIRLVYSLAGEGSQIQVLNHPRPVQLNDRGLLADEAWYLISLQVSDDSDQLKLSVKPMNHAHEPDTQQVTHRLLQTFSSTSSMLGVTPYGEADINLLVGSLPPAQEFSPPSQINSSRLTGCLYDLTLNDQQVGLYNFKTNRGCEGCWEGPQEQRETATFSFTGASSYATVAPSRFYDRQKYMVSMSARTTDSEALIFLALSETSNHYLSVFLSQGRVHYLIGKLSPSRNTNYLELSSSGSLFDALNAQLGALYSTSSTTSGQQSTTGQQTQNQQQQKPIEHIISTSREYNSGHWFKITAEKDQDKLVLVVDDEYKESTVDEKLLALDMDQIFFGGVWPLIKPSRFAGTSLELRSYSGCLRDLQLETSPVDLLRRQSYGVETGCTSSQSSRTLTTLLRSGQQVTYPLPIG